MLASYNAMVVCMNNTLWYSIKTAKQIKLVFGIWVSPGLPYTVPEGISDIPKKGTFLRNFVLNYGLHGTSTVPSVVN